MSARPSVPPPEGAGTASAGRPSGAGEPEALGHTVAAVARRLGVAPATLRTWDRRYGLGPSQHSAGAHRRYSPEDLARLERMRRLVLSGITPGEAARAVLSDPEAGAEPRPTGSARHGGGSVVPIPGGTPAARGLARAALSLDSAACRQTMADSLDRRGTVWTWDHLIVPVLVGLGQRWQQTGRGIDVEHVLSGAVQNVLAERVTSAGVVAGVRPVLLASAPDERHSLPLWAVAAALAERGVDSRILGASTPWSALAEALRRIGPAAVLVWSQTPVSGDATALADLPELRPDPLILLGGPGWSPQPGRGRRVHDLTEAVDTLARAAGA